MPESPPVGASPDQIIDDVFLTPRVLDGGAFDGYAESLRSLIRDAEDRSTKLSSTSADTEKLCLTIREVARQLQQRTTRGGKLALSLQEHTTRAETLIDRLASAISNDHELERLADQVIEQRRAAFEKRVADSVEDLFARYTEAQHRAESAEQRTRKAEQAIENISKQAAELESRINALTGRVTTSISDAEAAIEKLKDPLDETVTKARREHDRLQNLTDQSIQQVKQAGKIALDQAERDVDALRLRSAEAIEQTETRADRAVSNALEAIEQLRTLAHDLTSSTSHDAEQLEHRLGPYQDIIQHAHTLLGGADTTGQLPAVLQRAESVRSDLESTTQSIANDVDRAGQTRRELNETVNAAAQSIDHLDTRRTDICENLEREIEAISGDLSPIERATAGLKLRLDQLEHRNETLAENLADPAQAATDAAEQLDRLRADTDEITAAALQRTEEAGMWLVKLIQRAEQLNQNNQA